VTHSDETITGPIRVQSNTVEIDHTLLTGLLLSTLSSSAENRPKIGLFCETEFLFSTFPICSVVVHMLSVLDRCTIDFDEYRFDETNARSLIRALIDNDEYRSDDTRFHNQY